MQYIYKYSSPLGGITAASNGTALTGLWFDGQKYFAGNLSAEHEERDLPVFQKTKLWLELYFSKKVPDFTPPLSTGRFAFPSARVENSALHSLWTNLHVRRYCETARGRNGETGIGAGRWRRGGPQLYFHYHSLPQSRRKRRKPYGLCGRTR